MSLASFGPERALREPPPRTGRARITMPVDVRSGGGSCAGVTQNVSRDGAFVVTRLQPVGERLTLRLIAPGYSVPLVLEAEVRWLRPAAQADGDRPAGIGVQFVDPPIGVGRLCLAALLEAYEEP